MSTRKELAKSSNLNPTEYERLTHQGRQICDQKEMGGGYCGSCSLETHVAQMRDPSSWVHSSKERWEEAAVEKEITDARSRLTEEERFDAAENRVTARFLKVFSEASVHEPSPGYFSVSVPGSVCSGRTRSEAILRAALYTEWLQQELEV